MNARSTQQSPHIAPSLLSANWACLGEELTVIAPLSDRIHLDVMDGHFVPNITFGPPVVAALRSWTTLPFDVHLMISPVDPFLEAFARAGADVLIIHPETTSDPLATLKTIKNLGCQAGIALNPETPSCVLGPLFDLLDLILVMTVTPGFGGQVFMESQLGKIKEVRSLIDARTHRPLLEVDGGISPKTAPLAHEAGADILVAGQAVFKDGPSGYARNIQALRAV